MNKKLNILFIGTPEFASFQLKKIIKKKKHKIKAIITKKEKNNILNPVSKISKIYNIKIFKPKSILELKKLKKKLILFNIDIAIVIAYGFIIPKTILKIPKFGCINIHASLLPKWRGAAPIQRTLLSNDKITGITIIKMNKFIDSGKIIYQKKYKIKENDTYKTLYSKLKKISAKILPNILKKIQNNNIKEKKQNKKNITYAKKIKKKEGLINWKENPKHIKRKIKAFCEWPKTFFYYKKYIIFIWSVKIKKKKNKKKYKNGEIIKYNKKGLKIFTKNKILIIKKIQLNNHKKMKISELINSKPKLFIKGNIIN